MSDIASSILAFIVAIGVLVSVHEFGHFWVARRLGFKVLRFSIGFGKPIARWRGAAPDHTEYWLSSIPLGGYVKMLDEREGPVAIADQPRAFNRRPDVAAHPRPARGARVQLPICDRRLLVHVLDRCAGHQAADRLGDRGLRRGTRRHRAERRNRSHRRPPDRDLGSGDASDLRGVARRRAHRSFHSRGQRQRQERLAGRSRPRGRAHGAIGVVQRARDPAGASCARRDRRA